MAQTVFPIFNQFGLFLSCIGYLGHPFWKEASWVFIASLFFSVRRDSAIDREGNGSRLQEKARVYGQKTIREGMQRLHERSAQDLSRHDATSWMNLVHQLDARTRCPASGCPEAVMVQPAQDRKSDHLVPCILSVRNRSAVFRYLLPNPLMGSCLVKVRP